MKQFLAFSLALLLLAGNALAQGAAAELIKQKAIQQRDLNNQQQGIAPPPAASPGAAPAAPSAPQGISSSQLQLIERLQTDLTAIKAGSPVASEQKQQLQADFAALAKGSAKPSKARLTKLAEDLSAALAGNNISVKDPAQLAKDLNIVMNSGNPNLSAAQTQSFVTAAQTLLKSGGVDPTGTQAVTGDLKAIVADLQQTKSKLYQ